MSHFNPAFKSSADQDAAIALIVDHGLDPRLILADALSAEGYYVFREGEPRFLDPDSDEPNVELRPWPEGFPWSELESHLTSEVLR
jgi:hypothetical protein